MVTNFEEVVNERFVYFLIRFTIVDRLNYAETGVVVSAVNG